jgi:hypothetical protein
MPTELRDCAEDSKILERASDLYPFAGPPFCDGLRCSHEQENHGHIRRIHDGSCRSFMAGQRSGTANSYRAFGASLKR